MLDFSALEPEIAAPAKVVSADEIADAIGKPRPTAEQRAVIESELEPALVVAGAGSGKTETMAARVLWLLANGKVRPNQILGLTFTRKAAGELAERIRERILELRRVGLLPGEDDPFDVPTIATYNSYANSLYRDNAIVLGRESDGSVLGEAAAWQLVRQLVVESGDDRLPDLDKNLEPIVRAVLEIARGVAENVVDTDALRRFAADFQSIENLPSTAAYAALTKIVTDVGALDVLLDLAEMFEKAKTARALVEYSDQVSLGLEIVRRQPRIAQAERDRYAVVLLDEYQDTSVVQTWLLAELFRGHPVMAVGDPNQSIYGWRGASASNLDDFAGAFDSSGARYALSTSWRNGRGILDAANHVVAPFVGGRVAVEKLDASPFATAEPVEARYEQSVLAEAAAVAAWLKPRLQLRDSKGNQHSAAILFRTRKMQPFFLEALRAQGIPFHVLGIGGLTSEPEIADLLSALSVLDDPGAGLELVRLLAGSRWRVGVQDLHALKGVGSWLRDRDYAGRQHPDEIRAALRASVSRDDGGSIVDALDFVAHAKDGHTALESFSEEGLARLRDAGRFFQTLRSRSGLDLPELVAFTMQQLQLDIEVTANERRVLGSANLDAFFDAVSGYASTDDSGSLRNFLRWLREAEQREDLTPRPEKPQPGTVQVLTVHGSKGLEWEHVAVPRLVESEFPGTPVEGYQGWLGFGRLPWPFRGDAAELPVFEWKTATTRKQVEEARAQFREAVKARSIDEERRLMYVAVTRAKHGLLLTGSYWATQKKPRDPSIFLAELAAAGIVPEPPAVQDAENNPLGDDVDTFTWPMDPLGARRAAVRAAADAVTAAEPAVEGPWADDLELLLEERRARSQPVALIDVPVRVSASRFKDYVTDPAAVVATLRRPMPERPYRATRLGTLFHSWVENRSIVGGDAAELDALASELDEGDVLADERDLARLRAIFEASEWADRRPVEVEREIHLPFAGHVVICKIDAVYSDGERFEIVDWKTGKAPKDAEDLEQKQLQLALYRLAYAEWSGIDPGLIDAAFFFVADDAVIRPAHVEGRAELEQRWRAAFPDGRADTP